MKLLKLLTIVFCLLLFSISVSFAQENTVSDKETADIQPDDNAGTLSGSVSDESSEKPESTGSVLSDISGKKVETASGGRSDREKASGSKKSVKKGETDPVEVMEEPAAAVNVEGDLFPINEGNFKYKRIPDIKLPEIKPEVSDSSATVSEISEPVQDPAKGFLGLSKTVSDVIVKGGVLLLILLIFILYRTRMARPRLKSSKKRNVLNSYRK